MSECDVAKFVRQNHCQRSFVGEYVQQTPAHHDCVSHSERLHWSGEQYPNPHLGLNIQAVRHHQIVDYRLQDLVNLPGGSDQSHILQTIDDIILGFMLPLTFTLKGRGILSFRALILDPLCRIHHDLSEFLVCTGATKRVSPESGLRLEMELAAIRVCRM